MSHYHINVFYSEEDGGYIADIPDLDSCSAFGQTPEQALSEVERALRTLGGEGDQNAIHITVMPGRNVEPHLPSGGS